MGWILGKEVLVYGAYRVISNVNLQCSTTEGIIWTMENFRKVFKGGMQGNADNKAENDQSV